MLSCTKFTFIISNRSIYTNAVLCGGQQGRFMKKILHENRNKRKWIKEVGATMPMMPLPNHLAEGATEGKGSSNSKRVAVLNKLFMRYITDLMATGTSSSDFLGKGIEINRVSVTPDFKGVNVFWIGKGTENDDNIEKLLCSNAGALRHELSQLRVMGVVPKITFVKDKGYAKLVEVEIRLAKADFGEDYFPVKPSRKLKSDFHLTTSLSATLRERIQIVEVENEDIDEYCEEIPPMRKDVFGLDHEDVLFRVQKAIKKSQGTHRTSSKTNTDSDHPSVNDDPMEFSTYKQQKEAFAQFLLKRQVTQSKAKRIHDKYHPESEYFRTQQFNEKNSVPYYQEVNDDEDYFDEEEDNNNNNKL